MFNIDYLMAAYDWLIKSVFVEDKIMMMRSDVTDFSPPRLGIS